MSEGNDRVDLGPRNRAALSQAAQRTRGEMDVSKALKVMRRYPLYSIYGAHRHRLLNEDMFERQSREAAGDVVRAMESGDEAAANEARLRVAEALGMDISP